MAKPPPPEANAKKLCGWVQTLSLIRQKTVGFDLNLPTYLD
jgi:hypothetical protein